MPFKFLADLARLYSPHCLLCSSYGICGRICEQYFEFLNQKLFSARTSRKNDDSKGNACTSS